MCTLFWSSPYYIFAATVNGFLMSCSGEQRWWAEVQGGGAWRPARGGGHSAGAREALEDDQLHQRWYPGCRERDSEKGIGISVVIA